MERQAQSECTVGRDLGSSCEGRKFSANRIIESVSRSSLRTTANRQTGSATRANSKPGAAASTAAVHAEPGCAQVKSLVEQQVAAEHAEAARTRQLWREQTALLLRQQDEDRMAMENASTGFDLADANTSAASLKMILAETRLEKAKLSLSEHNTLLKALQKDQKVAQTAHQAANKELDKQFKKLMKKHGSVPGAKAVPNDGPSLRQLRSNVSGSIAFQIDTSLEYQRQQVECSRRRSKDWSLNRHSPAGLQRQSSFPRSTG